VVVPAGNRVINPTIPNRTEWCGASWPELGNRAVLAGVVSGEKPAANVGASNVPFDPAANFCTGKNGHDKIVAVLE
jgi:hypothetical protein